MCCLSVKSIPLPFVLLLVMCSIVSFCATRIAVNDVPLHMVGGQLVHGPLVVREVP